MIFQPNCVNIKVQHLDLDLFPSRFFVCYAYDMNTRNQGVRLSCSLDTELGGLFCDCFLVLDRRFCCLFYGFFVIDNSSSFVGCCFFAMQYIHKSDLSKSFLL